MDVDDDEETQETEPQDTDVMPKECDLMINEEHGVHGGDDGMSEVHRNSPISMFCALCLSID